MLHTHATPLRRRPAFRLAVPAVVIAALLGCSGGSAPTGDAGATAGTPMPAPAEQVGDPLAKVNGATVGGAAWLDTVHRRTPEDGERWTTTEKREILDDLIDEELLFQEAFARGLYQDGKVRKILSNLLLRSEIYDKVRNEDFSEQELRAFFDEHRKDFVVPEKAQILRIFVAALGRRSADEAKALALELHAKVAKQPGSFRDLAVEHSDGPFAQRGGDLGFVERDGRPGVPGQVFTTGFGLEEGAISEPFEAGGGWNIVQLVQRRERIERTFEQMRGSVLRRMKNERYEQLTEAFVEGLRAKASISVDEGALATFDAPVPKRPSARVLERPVPSEGIVNPPPPADEDPLNGEPDPLLSE
ncbi:MAG: peptidylprolyl isomerase [Alphaproteobacteria bacterium]|nr:peptidylprolyl isomerase [Alphaproteobacteria bacterium]